MPYCEPCLRLFHPSIPPFPCPIIVYPLALHAAEAATPAAVYLRFSAYRIEDRKVLVQGARWIPPLATWRKARKGSQSGPLSTQAFCGAAVIRSHDRSGAHGRKGRRQVQQHRRLILPASKSDQGIATAATQAFCGLWKSVLWDIRARPSCESQSEHPSAPDLRGHSSGSRVAPGELRRDRRTAECQLRRKRIGRHGGGLYWHGRPDICMV